MFFELEDVKRRHNPHWWTNNVTGWHTAVDSTPRWNYERGLITGLIVAPFQQYLSHFIHHAKVMLRHYENPLNLKQWYTFIKETTKLQTFKSSLPNIWQLGFLRASLVIAPQIALFRQFNSGWSSNFGGFEISYYRKLPTILAAFVFSSPLGVAVDMVQRAYIADKSFPKELQKGYKSIIDAFRRIPFEEGPYYLFKNTFPLYVKHIFAPFTLFYTYDWMVDKMSLFWRTTNMPQLPLKWFCAGLATYLAAIFTYPLTNAVIQLVDYTPKKNGVDVFAGNYRKAAVYLWFSPFITSSWYGLFKNFFWHNAPQWFLTLMVADKLGIFRYWRTDIFSGAADNNPQDSFI